MDHTDDYYEDHLAVHQPSFNLEEKEWLELDLISQCIDEVA